MLGTNKQTGDTTYMQPCTWEGRVGFIQQTFHREILLEVFYDSQGNFVEFDERKLNPDELKSIEKEKRVNYDPQY